MEIIRLFARLIDEETKVGIEAQVAKDVIKLVLNSFKGAKSLGIKLLQRSLGIGIKLHTNKTQKPPIVVMKLDLEKAYDKVN
jgi:hypothetical protein